MKVTALQIRNVVFWALISIFAILAAIISTGMGRLWGPKLLTLHMLIYLAITLLALGVVLVVLTVKLKEPRIRKLFFVLTGASAVGIPICVVLHNLVYALFFHGKGGDEAVFFILALFVCPALFAIGAMGSIVLLIRDMIKKQ